MFKDLYKHLNFATINYTTKQSKRLYKANKYIIGGISMEYPTVYDLFCYDMVTGQRVRIIREDYEGLRICVNDQEVYRPYRDLRKL